MRVLHVNTSDRGGAANSCIRLHRGLLAVGAESDLLVLGRSAADIPRETQFRLPRPKGKLRRAMAYVRQRGHENRSAAALRGRPKGYEMFSFPDTLHDITAHPLYASADIVNLHWVAGFLDWATFFAKLDRPLVWTLHDMNSFTGGCHYSDGCYKFRSGCDRCPQLEGAPDPTISAPILALKKEAVARPGRMAVVTPSVWLGEESRSSAAFGSLEHHVIPYGLDADVFRPRDRSASRELLGLPQEKKVVLFVSQHVDNRRKGYAYLRAALDRLAGREDVVACVIGSGGAEMGENVVSLGTVADERLMSAAYSAADVFLLPSIEDNLPNTVLESLMCGTPAIGFSIGGVPDMIDDGVNGWLCAEVSERALADRLEAFLADPVRFDRARIRENAVALYDQKIQARRYIDLYERLLQ